MSMRHEDALTEDLQGRTKRGSLLISSSIVRENRKELYDQQTDPKARL
jgi:hypothetical protein